MTSTDEQLTRFRYAEPVDVDTYGEYRIAQSAGDTRPLYRFAGRITTDGSSGFAAEPGRYHLYSGWFCPWAQRTVIVRALLGLEDVVSLSYVHGRRDGRGWAFREPTGPDPVNGFTLLRQAYEATESGFDGHVSVPTLWDRRTGTVVSNTFGQITIDLATQFEAWARPGTSTYPEPLRAEIDALSERILVTVNHGVAVPAGRGDQAYAARETLLNTLNELDERLAVTRYLHGDTVTESDVRLWVTLVRYDVNSNADGAIGPRRLIDYPHLWAYARDLFQQPAFRDSTDFTSFAKPGAVSAHRAVVAGWDAPHGRGPAD